MTRLESWMKLAFAPLALWLAACGPTRIELPMRVPEPTLAPVSLPLAIRVTDEFSGYVRKDEVNEVKWEINLGPMQGDAFERVARAMFSGATVVKGAAPVSGIPATLQVSLDNFVFLAPSGTSDYYASTVWYRADLYAPDGSLLGSWPFQGYGSVNSAHHGVKEGVSIATGRAVRDAFANFAAHFPEQQMLRQLLVAPTPAPEALPAQEPAAPAAAPAPTPDAPPATAAATA